MSDISYTVLSNLKTISLDEVIIYENIWLGSVCNLVGGRYVYTFNNSDTNIPNKNVNLLTTAIRYKMDSFIYKSRLLETNTIQYSTGTAWFGEGQFRNAGFGIDNKIDIQSMIRCICRQEIEYSLWNFIVKLKENNVFDGNPSSLRLKWFYNIEYPSNNITLNGFPVGTDNTEFPTIQETNVDNNLTDEDNTELLINNQN